MSNILNNKNSYYHTVPEELRWMCLINFRTAKAYCAQAILEFLKDRIEDYNADIFHIEPLELVKWIDAGIESLLPLEFNREVWSDYSDEIARLITDAEKLLEKDVKPQLNIENCHVLEDADSQLSQMVEVTQKMSVYKSILYCENSNCQEFKENLDRLLKYTKNNILYMMSLTEKEALQYAKADDGIEYHYVWSGLDRWEPLVWLTKEMLSDEICEMLLAQTLEEYALFLEELCGNCACNKAACSHLHHKGELRLRDLCSEIIDGIEDEIEFSEGSDCGLLNTKTQFEKRLQASKDRFVGLSLGKGDMNIDSISDEFWNDDNMKKWYRFSEHLKDIIGKNPELPIVILNATDELMCDVGYVYKRSDDSFKCKIIAVYGEKKKYEDEIDEYPF